MIATYAVVHVACVSLEQNCTTQLTCDIVERLHLVIDVVEKFQNKNSKKIMTRDAAVRSSRKLSTEISGDKYELSDV